MLGKSTIALLGLSLLALSCRSPLDAPSVSEGTVKLSFATAYGSSLARNSFPSTSLTISSYTYTLSNSSYYPSTITANSTTASASIASVKVGTWAVSVEGYSGSTKIAKGSGSVIVASGTTASATINLTLIAGTGTFYINISVPNNCGSFSSSASITPLGVSGATAETLSLTTTTGTTNTTISYTDTQRATGAYLLTTSLTSTTAAGTVTNWGITEVVYILSSLSTSFQRSLTSSDLNAIPITPTGLACSLLTNTSVGLSWTDPTSKATSFDVERANVTSGVVDSYVKIGSASAHSYTDESAKISMVYSYRVKAIGAFGTSAYSTAATIDTGVVVNPVFNIDSGVYSLSTTSSPITCTTATDGATIHYYSWIETNSFASHAQDPTETETIYPDTGIALSTLVHSTSETFAAVGGMITIKAIAIKAGCTSSAVITKRYTFVKLVAPVLSISFDTNKIPALSWTAGSAKYGTNTTSTSYEVERATGLSASTGFGVSVTDLSSRTWTEPAPIAECTYRVRSLCTINNDSTTGSTRVYSEPSTLSATRTVPAAPTFTPDGGTVDTTVTITPAAGTTVRYTTDGSSPTVSGTVYNGTAIEMNDIVSLLSIRAIAYNSSACSPYSTEVSKLFTFTGWTTVDVSGSNYMSPNFPNGNSANIDTNWTITQTGATSLKLHFQAFNMYNVSTWNYVKVTTTPTTTTTIYSGNLGGFLTKDFATTMATIQYKNQGIYSDPVGMKVDFYQYK